MPELVADLFVTLDGYAAGVRSPAYFGYDGRQLQEWIHHEMDRRHVIVMGRVTYQLLSSMPAEPPERGRRMEELPKLVFSRTLREAPSWPNTRIVDRDLLAEIRALKEGPGDPMRTMGSLSVVRQLLAAGLVDRLRLMIFPQILGETGREPIFAGLPDLDLQLLAERCLDSRLLLLEYRPQLRDSDRRVVT